MLGTQWCPPSQSCVPEYSEEFFCTQFFTPFWTPLCYILHIFSLKAYEAKPTGKKRAYISLWTDILWTLCVLVLMHAYFITMKTSSTGQDIKLSLVYSFYSHDSEKANDIWFFPTLIYYIWSTPLACDLWIKWKCIWKVWEQVNICLKWICLKWNTNNEINMNIKISILLCVSIMIWLLILVDKEL